MPAPVLDGCTEPLVEGAPDLRGLWEVVFAESNGQPANTFVGSQQRIEQRGNRIVNARKSMPCSPRPNRFKAF